MNSKPEPTPSEIARACEAIQQTWTDAEREKRVAHKVDAWTPLQLSTPIDGDAGADRSP